MATVGGSVCASSDTRRVECAYPPPLVHYVELPTGRTNVRLTPSQTPAENKPFQTTAEEQGGRSSSVGLFYTAALRQSRFACGAAATSRRGVRRTRSPMCSADIGESGA